MDSQYTLPVSAMVEVMLPSSAMVMLQAPLSSLPGVLREECLATLIIGQKRIHACTLTTKAGRVILQQQDAYAALERCGDLNWSVFPISGPSTHASLQFISPQLGVHGVSHVLSTIPSIRTQLTSEIVATLSSPYRRVIVLVDGKRSVEEIARLLNKTPQEVQQMLTALQHLVQF